jgi:putative endonuclease
VKSTEFGLMAEDRVAAYLKRKGFYIAKRNYKSRYGEIDIVAEDKTRVVFVEVKARTGDYLVSPADAVDKIKQRKIIATAKDYYVKSHCLLTPRFDVAMVTAILDDNDKWQFELSYLKNAFCLEAGNGVF